MKKWKQEGDGSKAGEVMEISGMASSEGCELFLLGQSPAEFSVISGRALQFRGI